MAGRPVALTPEAHRAILDAVSAGATLKTAASCAQVGYRSLTRWVSLGRKGGPAECVALVADLEKATAQAIVEALTKIRGREQPWQAMAWWLERTYPELYGRENHRIRELERQVAELCRAVELRGQGGAEAAPGGPSGPPESGD
jgi:transposase